MFKKFFFLFFATPAFVLAKTELKIAEVDFKAPPAWKAAAPASSMRSAQWSLPVRAKGSEPAEAVVFYFGQGQGGDAPSNIQRWIGLMISPQGTPTQGIISNRAPHGLKVSEVVDYGTYSSGMPIAGIPSVPKPGFGLVGVVLEGPQGNIFVRMVGPEKEVKANLADFRAFIDSATPVK